MFLRKVPMNTTLGFIGKYGPDHFSHSNVVVFFSIKVFFRGHWQLTGQQRKKGDHLLFHSTTSTRSQTFRHLFVTLHARWLLHIFNENACIYQTATLWDLAPPYLIITSLNDDVILIFVCLLVDLILGFLIYNYFTWETGVLELASTIILVIQANRLTKCASHPNIFCNIYSVTQLCFPILTGICIFMQTVIKTADLEVEIKSRLTATLRDIFPPVILINSF